MINLYAKTSLLLFLISFSINAQNIEHEKVMERIGFSFSSFGEFLLDGDENLIGGPGYDEDNFYSIGINFQKPIKNWLELEIGLEYSRFGATIYSITPPITDNSSHAVNFSLMNIPLTARVNFLKFLFLNGGGFLGFNTKVPESIDLHSGIGIMAGLGIKYEFKFGVSIFVNPYSKFHSLFKFSQDTSKKRIYENGVKIGITYNLK